MFGGSRMMPRIPRRWSAGVVSWLMVALVTGLVQGTDIPPAAAFAHGAPRVIQPIFPAELGLPHPEGITYSPNEAALILISGTGTTMVSRMTPTGEVLGGAVLASPIPDPALVTYDSIDDRLLVVRGDRDIRTIDDETLLRERRPVQLRTPVLPVSLGESRGVAFDDATGILYVLDAGRSRVVSIAPDPATEPGEARDLTRGRFGSVQLTGVTRGDMFGLAINLTNSHFYTFSESGQFLYEFGTDGALVATHDIGATGIVAPLDMVFAPSADPTDSESEQSLYITTPTSASTWTPGTAWTSCHPSGTPTP